MIQIRTHPHKQTHTDKYKYRQTNERWKLCSIC